MVEALGPNLQGGRQGRHRAPVEKPWYKASFLVTFKKNLTDYEQGHRQKIFQGGGVGNGKNNLKLAKNTKK